MKLLLALSLACTFAQATTTTLKSIDGIDLLTGQATSVSLQKQKPTAVIFLSNRCPCSQGHEYLVHDAASKFGDMSLVVVNSNANETNQEFFSYFKPRKFAMPVIRDEKSKIADALGAVSSPWVVVLNKNSEIVFSGGLTDTTFGKNYRHNYLDEALSALRGGKNPDIKNVKGVGCKIQRPIAAPTQVSGT